MTRGCFGVRFAIFPLAVWALPLRRSHVTITAQSSRAEQHMAAVSAILTDAALLKQFQAVVLEYAENEDVKSTLSASFEDHARALHEPAYRAQLEDACRTGIQLVQLLQTLPKQRRLSADSTFAESKRTEGEASAGPQINSSVATGLAASLEAAMATLPELNDIIDGWPTMASSSAEPLRKNMAERVQAALSQMQDTVQATGAFVRYDLPSPGFIYQNSKGWGFALMPVVNQLHTGSWSGWWSYYTLKIVTPYADFSYSPGRDPKNTKNGTLSYREVAPKWKSYFGLMSGDMAWYFFCVTIKLRAIEKMAAFAGPAWQLYLNAAQLAAGVEDESRFIKGVFSFEMVGRSIFLSMSPYLSEKVVNYDDCLVKEVGTYWTLYPQSSVSAKPGGVFFVDGVMVGEQKCEKWGHHAQVSVFWQFLGATGLGLAKPLQTAAVDSP